MSKRFSILLIVLTIISGLIGGAITGRIFAVNPAQAVEMKQSKVLTAEELRIVDKDGKIVTFMSVDTNGGSVSVFGKDGKVCVIQPNSMRISDFDSKSDRKGSPFRDLVYVGAEASDKNGGLIWVADRDGKGRAEMSVNEYGGQFGAFNKVDDKVKAGIGINEYGHGSIGLWDKDGYRLK